MRAGAIFLIFGGLILTALGIMQYIEGTTKQKESLAEAYKIISQTNPVAMPVQTIPYNERKKTSPSFVPKKGEVIGMLSIPSIQAELPIVEGTDEDELEKGIGHYTGTAFPLMNDQIVLSGHRDTVFRRLGDVKAGDSLILQMPYGSFTYKMVSSKIVPADDRSVIHSTAPKEVLTVTTCYPFSYIGNAPDRYILTAVPLDE